MTKRERQLLNWIEENPLISQRELAEKIDFLETLHSVEELESRREVIKSRVKVLIAQRQELRKELRRLTRKGNQVAADGMRDQIGQLSQELKKLRKEVALCDGIAARSERVRENLERRLTEQAIERKEKAATHKQNRSYDIGR